MSRRGTPLWRPQTGLSERNMKLIFALVLSVFIVYIVIQGEAIWYIALVWLVPLTLVVWWEAVPSLPESFINKFLGK